MDDDGLLYLSYICRGQAKANLRVHSSDLKKAKITVESHCPRVVTSADVMAIVTRDKVQCANGKKRFAQVALSPRLQEWLETFLTRMTVCQIIRVFRSKALSTLDIEAHSVAAGSLMSRIYGGNRSFDIESNMDQNPKTIRETCPEENFDPTVLAPNDPIDSIDFRQRHLP
ncbi:hypothetical protein SADUNF_Sadunf05G0062900 [Salix dunnii]|uniref:Plant heme peroxidase family profile domain-containing protein n=1 Tax=Salix dunnii TaxID=1413687 RepID=A0A835N1X3_9ROSI|nr:hypothetical protein SADUNF_Sadunf05G0062900 [Salix dunnii]